MRRICVLAGLLLGLALLPASATAAPAMETFFSDNGPLLADPKGMLQRLRVLGVSRVRLFMEWSAIAPRPNATRAPNGFDATDPASYPASSWAPWDAIVTDAANDGIGIDLNMMGPAPRWARGPGDPKGGPHPGWEPSASQFGKFVTAVAIRYGGQFDPTENRVDPQSADALPAIDFWSIWNEPNYGPTLAPQGVTGHLTIEHSPAMYRALLDSAWSALVSHGHAHDTILWGDLAPRGRSFWGVFSGIKPLHFLRTLFCVDGQGRRLRGAAASVRGCPASGGAAAFRAAHPALFQASGVALHLYMRWYPPDIERDYDPDFASLAEIGGATSLLDRLQRAYGSNRRLPVYDTEFGYITAPPKPPDPKAPYVSPGTAAIYDNWAEYLHWRNPRLRSFDQYQLADPYPSGKPDYGGYSDGIEQYGGRPKPGYAAFRMPIWLPGTNQARGGSLEVWGCVRPARFAAFDTGLDQAATVEFAPPGGHFRTIRSLSLTDAGGYFDTRIHFPSSGTVRIAFTYPPGDALLPSNYTIRSRSVAVTVR